MKYMGSKNRIASHILPLILKDRKAGQWYVEPFCGGCNLIDKVATPRMANDTHAYLIAMFTALQTGWKPPQDVSEEKYKDIQKQPLKYPSELVGYVGFNLSYGGKWFGGYRRDSVGKRNYSLEAYNNVMEQGPRLRGIIFSQGSYNQMNIPANSIIYCDPPYENTTKYSSGFDHGAFWKWCTDMSNKGHTLFISEYQAPENFQCIWQKTVTSSLTKNTGSKTAVEKLFTTKPRL